MKTTISATEVARHFGDVLARVRYKHEHFVLTKNERPIAEITPFENEATVTWAELESAMNKLPYDPAFADDLERVCESDKPLDNPWG